MSALAWAGPDSRRMAGSGRQGPPNREYWRGTCLQRGIFGGLLCQTSEKPRISAALVGQKAGILSAIILELWRSTFYHPPENVGKTQETGRRRVRSERAHLWRNTFAQGQKSTTRISAS